MDSTHLIGEQSKDGQEASQQDNKQVILSLPKENAWILSQNLHFQCFWCPSNLIVDTTYNLFSKQFSS